jgi:hypothetical protein
VPGALLTLYIAVGGAHGPVPLTFTQHASRSAQTHHLLLYPKHHLRQELERERHAFNLMRIMDTKEIW